MTQTTPSAWEKSLIIDVSIREEDPSFEEGHLGPWFSGQKGGEEESLASGGKSGGLMKAAVERTAIRPLKSFTKRGGSFPGWC